MSADPRCPYRVVIRTEGEWVNAYWARTGTMEGAEKIASMSRLICDTELCIAECFQALCSFAAIALVEARLHTTVEDVEVTSAPEHERSGSA